VKLDDKTYKMIEVCRQIFLKFHPYYESRHLSCNKMLGEAMKYYIKTEPEFADLIKKGEQGDAK
jgi:hypothetical protein